MNMVIDSKGNSEFSPGLEALVAERGYTKSELAARVAIAVSVITLVESSVTTLSMRNPVHCALRYEYYLHRRPPGSVALSL